MFYEWVSAGAIFGIEAFFAVFTFALIIGAVLGLLGLIARVVKGEDK